MSIVSRNHLPLVFLAAVGATAVAACWGSPDDEPAAKSYGEALTARPTCAANQVAVSSSDPGPNGKPVITWECVQAEASNFTTAPGSATGDTCGSPTVATPASISTCSLGILIDKQPVFACPVGTALPASLGLVTVNRGVCDQGGANPDELWGTCEEVITLPASFSSNCLGSPKAGWELVIDVQANLVTPDPADASSDASSSSGSSSGGQGGGCGGPCAVSVPPPAMR